MPGERPDPSLRIQLLASILDQIACPACFSALCLDATDLVCEGCGRIYPVIDGIPALIPEPDTDEGRLA